MDFLSKILQLSQPKSGSGQSPSSDKLPSTPVLKEHETYVNFAREFIEEIVENVPKSSDSVSEQLGAENNKLFSSQSKCSLLTASGVDVTLPDLLQPESVYKKQVDTDTDTSITEYESANESDILDSSSVNISFGADEISISVEKTAEEINETTLSPNDLNSTRTSEVQTPKASISNNQQQDSDDKSTADSFEDAETSFTEELTSVKCSTATYSALDISALCADVGKLYLETPIANNCRPKESIEDLSPEFLVTLNPNLCDNSFGETSENKSQSILLNESCLQINATCESLRVQRVIDFDEDVEEARSINTSARLIVKEEQTVNKIVDIVGEEQQFNKTGLVVEVGDTTGIVCEKQKPFEVLVDEEKSVECVVDQIVEEKNPVDSTAELVIEEEKPVDTTAELVVEQGEPVDTTAELVVGEKKPVDTTAELVVKEEKSVDSAAELVIEKEKPVDTTAELVVNEEKSVDTTAELVVNEEKSVDTTAELVVKEDKSTAELVVNEEKPVDITAELVVKADKSVDSTAELEIEEEKPVDTTAELVVNEEKPVDITAELVVKADESVDSTAELVIEEEKPVDTTAELVVNEEKSVDTTAELVVKADESVDTTAELVIEEEKPVDTTVELVVNEEKSVDTTADLVIEEEKTVDITAELVVNEEKPVDTAAELVIEAEKPFDTTAELVVKEEKSVDTAAEFVEEERIEEEKPVDTTADFVVKEEKSVDTAVELVIEAEKPFDTTAELVVKEEKSVDTAAELVIDEEKPVDTTADFVVVQEKSVDTTAELVVKEEKPVDTTAVIVIDGEKPVDIGANTAEPKSANITTKDVQAGVTSPADFSLNVETVERSVALDLTLSIDSEITCKSKTVTNSKTPAKHSIGGGDSNLEVNVSSFNNLIELCKKQREQLNQGEEQGKEEFVCSKRHGGFVASHSIDLEDFLAAEAEQVSISIHNASCELEEADISEMSSPKPSDDNVNQVPLDVKWLNESRKSDNKLATPLAKSKMTSVTYPQDDDPFSPRSRLNKTPPRDVHSSAGGDAQAAQHVHEQIHDEGSDEAFEVRDNHSEAGPEIAQPPQSEEIFVDSSGFDFLSSKGGPDVTRNLRLESLYVKFDPLVSAQPVARTDRNIPLPPLFHESSTRAVVSPLPPRQVDEANDVRTASTPPRNPAIAFVERLISLSPSPCKQTQELRTPSVPSTPIQAKESASPVISTTSQTADEMNEELLILRELMDHHDRAHEELLAKQGEEKRVLEEQISGLQMQLTALSEREHRLAKQLAEKTQAQIEMNMIMEEYEKTISRLVAEKEHDQELFDAERQVIVKEKEQAQGHLTSIEGAFSDVHKKYERSKVVIEGFKKNELVLKENLKKCEQTIRVEEQKYETLKNHAMAKLESANQTVENMKKTHSADMSKLSAKFKKAELKASTLQESLDQKIKENIELSSICDDLISKVS